jgi:Ca2+-binding EF-hand superfamily protein/tRNA A-37 threonylcarbamoyl transferase component Bud32
MTVGKSLPSRPAKIKVVPQASFEVGSEYRMTFEHKRKVLETLANPNIKHIAEDFYTKMNRDGAFSLRELQTALSALTKTLNMPPISNNLADSMFKKFDVNGDGKLSANEFYELFVASLRRVAFDQSSLMGRSVFVSKQHGRVWDHYKHLKVIGKGSFATTYLTQNRHTGDERVVKAVEKSRMKLPIEDIEREILVLSQIDHPHIVRFYEWYEGSNTVYLVIDSLKGGTLREVVLKSSEQGAGLREEWIREVVSQVVTAMAYCHKLRLIHKDIKDENIMLLKKSLANDKPYAVIIDLGVAEMFALSDPHGNIVGGTPATMAPEVWTCNFGPKCDVWSTGCVLFELLAGSMPFLAVSFKPKDWARKLKAGPDWNLVRTSDHGKDLCRKMLTYSDHDRPTMDQCLQHPWFTANRSELQEVVKPRQFEDLKRFCEVTALSRSLLLEIACRLPMDKAEKIVQVFQAFDENSDGHISRAELERGFARLGMKDRGILESTFKALDVDHNGTLSFSEFAAGVLLMFKDLLEARFRLLFRRHCKSGDGMMSREDVESFLSVARKIAKKDATEHHREVISELFSGGDSKVSYEDLRRVVLPGYQ